ncbi:MAG: heavy metal-associated domain-containing protein [Bdellovibrionota bacterium]
MLKKKKNVITKMFWKRGRSAVVAALALTMSAASHAQDATGQYTLRVDKMMCGSCTARVKKSIQSHPGVESVDVSLDTHEAQFSCKKDAPQGACDVETIKKDLQRIGYPGRIVNQKPAKEDS